MYLSASNCLKIFLTLLMFNNVNLYDTDIDNYKKFYYHMLDTDEPTTFVVNSLWRGVEKDHGDDSQCYNDISYYHQELNNREEWAVKMYDSSTHLQPGFLEGNVIDLGNTEECINTVNGPKYENEPIIKGSMCYITFITGNKSDSMVLDRYMITFSLCVPSSCNKSQVDRILRYGIQFRTYYYVGDCVKKETFSPPYENKAYYIIILFIGLLTVILLSTGYDVLKTECYSSSIEENDDRASLIKSKKDESKFEGALMSFSLYRNGKALLQEDTKEESIKALHGLRFFAACGVLCVHRHLLDPQPFTNMFMIDEEMRKWYRMIQFNAYLWVDVFFLMSGLLVSYNFLLRSENKRRLNVWKFYFHRYIRLTPTLAAVILLNLLADHMCSGPHCSYLIRLFKDRCEKNWWGTLLYINNIHDQFHMCVIQAWYLAADMQMYWCAPVLLYTLIRWRRLIFIELLLLFTATASWVFFISYKLGLLATFIGTNQFFEDDSKYVYNQFFARAGPWLIGFALGIKLQQHNEEPIKLSKFSVLLGWIIAPIFCLVPMFGIAPFVQKDYERNPLLDSLFKALHRDVWVLGFAWIIYACYTGHGGWVNKFLSSYIFHPISRLSYSFYLIHIFGQFLQFQGAYVPRPYNDLSQFALLSGDVIIGMILAVILHLSVEAPSLNLEKVLCNRKATKESEESKRRIVKEA